MLCKRPTKKIEETVREMGGTEFIIEEKLDGERIQLHKRGNEYFYCSRFVICAFIGLLRSWWTSKGKDYTYLYGKNVGTGSLTPFIDKAFDPRVDEWVSPSWILSSRSLARLLLSVILDGEMLVWDPVSERNLPFGTLKTAALGKWDVITVGLENFTAS